VASWLVLVQAQTLVRGINCVVFFGKTLNSHSASLTQAYKWVRVPTNLMLRVTL